MSRWNVEIGGEKGVAFRYSAQPVLVLSFLYNKGHLWYFLGGDEYIVEVVRWVLAPSNNRLLIFRDLDHVVMKMYIVAILS